MCWFTIFASYKSCKSAKSDYQHMFISVVWDVNAGFVKRSFFWENYSDTYLYTYSLFQLCPENAEEYIDYLRSVGRLDEAALRLAAVVNDESFVSKEGKSNYQVRVSLNLVGLLNVSFSSPLKSVFSWVSLYFFLSFLQLWHELCDLISQNPDKVTSLNVGAIIRGGLTRFTDQLGKLWCSLADYYIRSGHFEKVRFHPLNLFMYSRVFLPVEWLNSYLPYCIVIVSSIN